MAPSRTKVFPPGPSGPGVVGPRRGPRSHRGRRRVVTTSAAALLALALAACGGSSSPSSGAGSSTTGSQVSEADGKAAASAAIEPLVGKPSAFPVNEPLGQPLPPGTKFAYLQCATTVCGLFGQLLAPPVAAIGGELTVVPSGSTASTSQAAVASVLALKPDAVLVAGVDPAQFGGGLKKLSDAGVKVVTISVAKDTAPFGITFNYIGADTAKSGGSLMADWVIARQGTASDVVFYGVPGIDYSDTMQKAFTDEMAKNCPSCKVRTVPIDIATLGTTASQTVVTDLQSKPSTKVAVFATSEVARGLPAALSAAGLNDIKTIGYAPTPANFQDIKDGKLTAGLGVDFALSGWVAVDAAARLILGQEPTAEEKAGEVPRQLLEQKDITFDFSRGWTGYPDFPQRFAKLWAA